MNLVIVLDVLMLCNIIVIYIYGLCILDLVKKHCISSDVREPIEDLVYVNVYLPLVHLL